MHSLDNCFAPHCFFLRACRNHGRRCRRQRGWDVYPDYVHHCEGFACRFVAPCVSVFYGPHLVPSSLSVHLPLSSTHYHFSHHSLSLSLCCLGCLPLAFFISSTPSLHLQLYVVLHFLRTSRVHAFRLSAADVDRRVQGRVNRLGPVLALPTGTGRKERCLRHVLRS